MAVVVVYNQNFRQSMAAKQDSDWTKVDPSMYTQAFLSMAWSQKKWCREYQLLDQAASDCPLSANVPKQQKVLDFCSQEVCRNYNDKDKMCHYCHCKYLYICKECKERHPYFQQKNGLPQAQIERLWQVC